MKSFLVPAALSSVVLLTACDSEPSGLLQQRIAELESQADAARKRADLLQAKLDAKEKEEKEKASAPAAPAPVKAESKEPDDEAKALVGAAATLLGESLREKVKPGMLHAYQEAAWAGYRLEKSGEARGVAVPFFRDASGQWICGWSDSQILAALEGNAPVMIPAAMVPAVAVPASMPVASPPASVSVPVSQPEPQPMPAATVAVPPPAPPPVSVPVPASVPAAKSAPPRSGSNKSFFVDPATGKLFRVRPDGTREPVPEMR